MLIAFLKSADGCSFSFPQHLLGTCLLPYLGENLAGQAGGMAEIHFQNIPCETDRISISSLSEIK